MVGRRIVGVVMRSRKKPENIDHMAPVPVIEHFFTDMDDWSEDAPFNLLSYFVDGELAHEAEEIVIIITALEPRPGRQFVDEPAQ